MTYVGGGGVVAGGGANGTNGTYGYGGVAGSGSAYGGGGATYVSYYSEEPVFKHTSLAGFFYGRNAPDYSKPRLWLEDYLTEAVPPALYPVDRGTMVPSWPMYLNDSIGDCTIAELGHAVGAFSVNSGEKGGEVLFANSVIQSVYSAISGYVTGNPNTDTGCVISDVLAYWESTGISDIRGVEHKINAYAQLVNTDPATLNWALKNFGCVYTGINCPESAEEQFANDQPWTYVQGSPIAGGHCIGLQTMLSVGNYGFTTWGKLQAVEQSFVDHYLEEAWVVISPDWITSKGGTITGLDVAQLQADMAVLG